MKGGWEGFDSTIKERTVAVLGRQDACMLLFSEFSPTIAKGGGVSENEAERVWWRMSSGGGCFRRWGLFNVDQSHKCRD